MGIILTKGCQIRRPFVFLLYKKKCFCPTKFFMQNITSFLFSKFISLNLNSIFSRLSLISNLESKISYLKSLYFFLFPLLLFFSCKKENTLFEIIDSNYSGIEFANTIIEKDTMNILDNEFVFNGGGVAVGDLNNDGLQDLYFTGSQVDNHLYLNRGELKFEEISKLSNTQKKGDQWSFGVNMIDINNDGKLDIYVCNSMSPDPEKRRNLLFENQGNDNANRPIFEEKAKEYGIDDPSHSDNAQFFDFDQDGDLDLFIAVNFIDTQFPNQYMTKLAVEPNKDILYENIGSDSLGHPFYKDVSNQAGFKERGYSHSSLVNDFNDDGLMDIYVANDYLTNDLIYINQKDKSGKNIFSNKIADMFKHQSYSAMGSDIADINNDGLLDIFTTEMLPYYNKRKKLFLNANAYNHYLMTEQYGYEYQFLRNTLQVNRGKNPKTGLPVFSDLSFYAGVQETDWSWAALFADFDNNGFKDLFVANGFPRDITDHDFGSFRKSQAGSIVSKDQLNKAIPQIKIPNFVFANNGELNFSDQSKNWGLTEPSFSNGAAYADLDNDGDLELITNNINDKAFLYKNTSQETAKKTKSQNNYLRVKLKGPKQNLDAFGSTVHIYYEKGKSQMSQVLSARGYLSKPESILHFGLNGVPNVDSLIVTWPDGKQTNVQKPEFNRVLKINYETSILAPNHTIKENPIFTKIDPKSMNLDYLHEEYDFIDFNLQKTLPHKMSQYTPPIAVGDLNSDGLDDVFFGGSSRKPDIVYFQNKSGKFSRKELNNLKSDEKQREENTGILIFDADNDGDNDVYITRGSYQNEAGTALHHDQLLVNDGSGNLMVSETALEKIPSCSGTIKAADFDADGDLDLFVGARVTPKAYPFSDKSYLLRNDTKVKDQPKFTDITKLWCPELVNIGMISDAIWTDFDNDNKIDLILAGEWKPIVFLKNIERKLVNITNQTGISDKVGWWNSLSASDYDNDGDIDYVAGNLGMNTFFKGTEEEPITMYAKDFDNNKLMDPLISCFWPDSLGKRHEYFYHSRDDMIKQSNLFRAKFNTYGQYGEATVQDIFTKDELEGAQIKKANWMYSSIIENLGKGRFKMTQLPKEAQYAPVYGTMPYDYDNDGLIDVLLVGNDYGMELLQGHADAFFGLVLKNLGQNVFKSVTLNESHFIVPKDAKAISKINIGKKELILATQNKDSLVMFKPKTDFIKTIKISNEEVFAKILFTTGKTQKREFYWGNTFASQEPRNLNWCKNFKQVIFYNYKNQKTRVID